MGPHSLLGSDPAAVAGATLDRGVLRRVWALARPYRGMLAGFLATIVAAALLALVPPLLFRSIIDTAIPDGDRRAITVLALLSVGAALGDAALAVAQRWWSSRIGEGLIYDLRVALFDHVQRMPVGFFTRTQTGALISRLNNDVVGAQSAVTGTLGSVVSNVIVLTSTLIAMLVLEWRLTLLALVVLPLFVVPAKRVGRALQRVTREQMNLNASMNATMTERFNVSGALLVKLFGRYDDEVASFAERAGRVRDIGIRSAMYGRVFFVAMGVVAAVGMAVVYGLGAQMVVSGAITVGTLVALSAYVTRIYMPLTALTNARVDLMTAVVSFERVFEVLDTPIDIADKPGAVDLVDPRGAITFDGVWFRYPTGGDPALASLENPDARPPAHGALGSAPDQPRGDAPDDADDEPTPDDASADGSGDAEPAWVLRGIEVAIAPGQLVALVGPSGAGKTTLSSLVPRLYDVTEGSVQVDGHDVRDLTQGSLRAAIGVVAQDPHLFHESIAGNLRYARPHATDAELEAACRAARIHDLVASLPQGYATVVGERGYRLSGGEKQRLAIARMLLKDPAVVILDEATSHLDSENEALVQQALSEALQGRTSIVIAHRLSTIRRADVILVLDGGQVVERGTHDELLEAGGLYADLYRTLQRDEALPTHV